MSISPGKGGNFPPMSPPNLLTRLRVVLDFDLCGNLVQSLPALYPFSVRRCGILCRATFSYNLTIATLPLANVPTAKPVVDVSTHASRTIKGDNLKKQTISFYWKLINNQMLSSFKTFF